MPVVYSIDVSRRTIHTTCSAPLVFDDVINHFRSLMQDPACSGTLDVLLDVSEGDRPPQSQHLGAIRTELAALRARVRFRICAIIATRDEMFGTMRMFEVHAGPYFEAIRVFRVAAEAEQWLLAQQSARAPGA